MAKEILRIPDLMSNRFNADRIYAEVCGSKYLIKD
jgi:hypothetical protein